MAGSFFQSFGMNNAGSEYLTARFQLHSLRAQEGKPN